MTDNTNALYEATEELVALRVKREDLTARIAAVESKINHLVGAEQLVKKLYSDLAVVCMMK